MRKVQDKMDGVVPEVIDLTPEDGKGEEAIGDVLGSPFLDLGPLDELGMTLGSHVLGPVRADLSGHLRYSRRWSGVRAGVLQGAQGAVRRGENRGGL